MLRRWFNNTTLDDSATPSGFHTIQPCFQSRKPIMFIFLYVCLSIFFPISKVLHDCYVGVSQHQRLSFHISINSWNFSNLTHCVAGRFNRGKVPECLGQPMMAMVKRNWGGGFGGFGGLFGSMFGQMNQMMEALAVGSRAVSPLSSVVSWVGWIAYVASSILLVKNWVVICCEVVWWWWIWPLKWSNAVVKNGFPIFFMRTWKIPL